jgi:hypothetical protein
MIDTYLTIVVQENMLVPQHRDYTYSVDEYDQDPSSDCITVKRHGYYSLTMADALCKRLTAAGKTVMLIAQDDSHHIEIRNRPEKNKG